MAAYIEVSVYGYITGDELEAFTGVDYQTVDATKFDEAAVMARVTIAERLIHGYLGVSTAQTITDGIKSATMVIAAKFMRLALLEFGLRSDQENTVDLLEMSTMTILRTFLGYDAGVDAIPMSGADR